MCRRERSIRLKEEIGKLAEQVVRSGQAVISGLKSETDKLIDEAVSLMDDKKKKTWKYISICIYAWAGRWKKERNSCL